MTEKESSPDPAQETPEEKPAADSSAEPAESEAQDSSTDSADYVVPKPHASIRKYMPTKGTVATKTKLEGQKVDPAAIAEIETKAAPSIRSYMPTAGSVHSKEKLHGEKVDAAAVKKEVQADPRVRRYLPAAKVAATVKAESTKLRGEKFDPEAAKKEYEARLAKLAIASEKAKKAEEAKRKSIEAAASKKTAPSKVPVPPAKPAPTPAAEPAAAPATAEPSAAPETAEPAAVPATAEPAAPAAEPAPAAAPAPHQAAKPVPAAAPVASDKLPVLEPSIAIGIKKPGLLSKMFGGAKEGPPSFPSSFDDKLEKYNENELAYAPTALLAIIDEARQAIPHARELIATAPGDVLCTSIQNASNGIILIAEAFSNVEPFTDDEATRDMYLSQGELEEGEVDGYCHLLAECAKLCTRISECRCYDGSIFAEFSDPKHSAYVALAQQQAFASQDDVLLREWMVIYLDVAEQICELIVDSGAAVVSSLNLNSVSAHVSALEQITAE